MQWEQDQSQQIKIYFGHLTGKASHKSFSRYHLTRLIFHITNIILFAFNALEIIIQIKVNWFISQFINFTEQRFNLMRPFRQLLYEQCSCYISPDEERGFCSEYCIVSVLYSSATPDTRGAIIPSAGHQGLTMPLCTLFMPFVSFVLYTVQFPLPKETRNCCMPCLTINSRQLHCLFSHKSYCRFEQEQIFLHCCYSGGMTSCQR